MTKTIVFLLLLFTALSSSAEEITIAAAADLDFAFQELAARFEKQTGIQVKLSFGSSGNFYAQIQNGAPYDLFFSADVGYPEKLQEAGLVEPDSLYKYAVGKLVLWTPNSSPIDVQQGLPALLDAKVHKIAIANPAHAPYGRAAESALKSAGIYDRVRSKLVLGENIAQAAHFVASGNADAGLLALSLALSPAMRQQGKFSLLPAGLYPPLDQAGIILKSSPRKQAAQRFMDFLRSPQSVELMRQYGFANPEQLRGAH